jgi:hypothetical protein
VTAIGEIFGVEADFGRTPGFFEREETGNNVVQSSAVHTVTGSLVIALSRRVAGYGLRPYAVVGGGIVRASIEDKQAVLPISDTMSAAVVGAGVTGFFNRRIGVNWDVRRIQSIGGYSLTSTYLTAPQERLSFWRATIGIAIH